MDSLVSSPPKRLSRVDGHWLWVGGPVPPGSIGLTLGSLVMVRKSAARGDGFAELLAHEQVHVRQFAELGVVRFLAVYLKSYARFRFRGYGHWQAYVRIPLEIEARVDARTKMHRVRPSSGANATVLGVGDTDTDKDAAAVAVSVNPPTPDRPQSLPLG